MGLALVHRIVTDHGGTLEFDNLTPSGARVRIVLPEAAPEPTHEVADPQPAHPTDHAPV